MDDKDRRKSTGVARAQVCWKTHLDWMNGFPVSQSHSSETQYHPGIARQRQADGFDDECACLLKAMIDLHPAKALRLLRETHPRKIRRELDEVDVTRRELLANCFTTLNRPAFAAALRK